MGRKDSWFMYTHSYTYTPAQRERAWHLVATLQGMTAWSVQKAFMSMPGRCNQSQHKQALPNGWDAFCLRRTQDSLPSSTKGRSFQSQTWEGKGRPREEAVPRVPHLARHLQSLRGERPDSRQKRVRRKMPREAGRLDTGAGANVCWASQGLQDRKSCADAGKGLGCRCGGSAAPQSHRGKMLWAPAISPLTTPKGRGITSLTDQNLRHWLNMGATGQGRGDKMCAVWGSLLPASKWESGPAATRLLHR